MSDIHESALEALREMAPTGASHYSTVVGTFYRQDGEGNWHLFNKKDRKWLPSANDRGGKLWHFIELAPVEEYLDDDDDDEPDDLVNSPSHYRREYDPLIDAVRSSLIEGHDGCVNDLECIEAMLSMFNTVDQIRGYLRGNSFKYRWRYLDKEPVRSLNKAAWYEDKLIKLEEAVEEHNSNDNDRST